MKKVLCLLAHSLYETYPEYFVNVLADQACLREHHILTLVSSYSISAP